MNEQTAQTSPTPSVTLRREIGLMGAISILAGIMIGSGIFYIGAIVLERAGMNPVLALAAWLVGGLVTLLSGLAFAELGAMMPKAGGYYAYLREAYGERIAFVSGVSHFLLSGPGSIAALAVAFAAAMATLVPMGEWAQKTVAVTGVVLLTAVNIRGVAFGVRLQTLFLWLKLVPIVALLLCGLSMGTEPITWTFDTDAVSVPGFFSMLGFAVIATLWAYEGWSNLNTVAEEIKRPQRTIPLALIVSILGVGMLYMLFHVALFRTVPLEALSEAIASGDYFIGALAAKTLFGEAGMWVVAAAMMLAIFNSLNGCVMVFPRLYFAMARDGALFAALGRLNPSTQTPINAQLASAAMAIVLIVFRSLSELTSLVAICALLINCLAFYSVIVLRRRQPDAPRPYRVWFYPVSIVFVMAVTAGLIVNTCVNDPVTALWGVAMAAVGWFAYTPTVGRHKSDPA